VSNPLGPKVSGGASAEVHHGSQALVTEEQQLAGRESRSQGQRKTIENIPACSPCHYVKPFETS